MPALPSPDRDRWWERGACYRSFDLRFHGSYAERKEIIAEFCDHCTVNAECRDYAKAHGDDLGVWGVRPEKVSR